MLNIQRMNCQLHIYICARRATTISGRYGTSGDYYHLTWTFISHDYYWYYMKMSQLIPSTQHSAKFRILYKFLHFSLNLGTFKIHFYAVFQNTYFRDTGTKQFFVAI